MPIDTTIDGDPASIRKMVTWLMKTLVPAIDSAVDDLFAARDQTESGWEGDAATVFHRRADSNGRNAFQFEQGVENFARSLSTFADDLETAQLGMALAREIATSGGLDLDDNIILDPLSDDVPAPVLGPPSPMTPAEKFSALADRVEAYEKAQQQAERTATEFSLRKETMKNVTNDLKDKWWILSSSFADEAFIGYLGARHGSKLMRKAQLARQAADLAAERHAQVPWGSTWTGSVNDMLRKQDDAAKVLTAVKNWDRVSRKLPYIGWGITVTDLGYDLTHGKPVDKTLVSAGGSALAGGVAAWGTGALATAGASGVLTGMGAGAAAGSVAPVIGTIVGAGIGAGVGLIAGGALDSAYDDQQQEDQLSGRDGSTHVNMIKDMFDPPVTEDSLNISDQDQGTPPELKLR